jgi:DNA-binding PadR family transcriptional regulator
MLSGSPVRCTGYIETDRIENISEQAGRPRIYYKLTSAGLDKLVSAQKVTKSIWKDIPDLEKVK